MPEQKIVTPEQIMKEANELFPIYTEQTIDLQRQVLQIPAPEETVAIRSELQNLVEKINQQLELLSKIADNQIVNELIRKQIQTLALQYQFLGEYLVIALLQAPQEPGEEQVNLGLDTKTSDETEDDYPIGLA